MVYNNENRKYAKKSCNNLCNKHNVAETTHQLLQVKTKKQKKTFKKGVEVLQKVATTTTTKAWSTVVVVLPYLHTKLLARSQLSGCGKQSRLVFTISGEGKQWCGIVCSKVSKQHCLVQSIANSLKLSFAWIVENTNKNTRKKRFQNVRVLFKVGSNFAWNIRACTLVLLQLRQEFAFFYSSVSFNIHVFKLLEQLVKHLLRNLNRCLTARRWKWIVE